MTQLFPRLTIAATSLALLAPPVMGQHAACTHGLVDHAGIASDLTARPSGSATAPENVAKLASGNSGALIAPNEARGALPVHNVSVCALPLSHFDDKSDDARPVSREDAEALATKRFLDFRSPKRF